MKRNNWYVVTGAPSSGKTTVISSLEGEGYHVVHEIARSYINQKLNQKLTIQEIKKDAKTFQDEIMKMQIKTEKGLCTEETVFLDRGIPDIYAYYNLYEIPFDLTLENKLKKASYKKIFLLDMLPYKDDYVRTESPEQQRRLYELIQEAYQYFGFKVVKVPVLSPQKRARFILNCL